MNNDQFEQAFNKVYEEKKPDYDKSINIALVGKVSAGKSSLLNAILGCDRRNPIADVGANSGVTTKVTPYKLDSHVLIIDCPGLDDVRTENSEVTTNFLQSVDLGIFVITGSADDSQRQNYEDLFKTAKKTIVVLNKIDEWDDLDVSAYEEVVDQWSVALGTKQIFGTCTKGYDPKMRADAKMDLRGIEEVRKEIFGFLEKEKKDIILARHLKDKEKYAVGMIAAALLAVAGEAFIPGSAAYITATQSVTITSLHYLYTGDVLAKGSVLGLLSTFAGQSIGTTAFLWAKSFLPPTGVVDLAAASIAVVITFAMLATVKYLLENGYTLDDKKHIKEAYDNFRKVGDKLSGMTLSDFKNKEAMIDFLKRIITAKWKSA